MGGKAACDRVHEAVDVQELLQNQHEGAQRRVRGKGIRHKADRTEALVVLSHARYINH